MTWPMYASAEDFRDRFLLAADGSEDPVDLMLGLREASILFERTPQIQSEWMIENFESVTADSYKAAVLEQVWFWCEIAGGDVVDLSQNTLRPTGGYSRIGSISIPQYQHIAPKALEALQTVGLFFPSPGSMAYYVEDS